MTVRGQKQPRFGSTTDPDLSIPCTTFMRLTQRLKGSYSYSYILQANEQNIKISIKQTQTQPHNAAWSTNGGDTTYT